MDQVSNKACVNVVKLEKALEVSNIHQVVHSLKRVAYVNLVVKLVVHEVPISNLKALIQ